jgi:hypothetical protein
MLTSRENLPEQLSLGKRLRLRSRVVTAGSSASANLPPEDVGTAPLPRFRSTTFFRAHMLQNLITLEVPARPRFREPFRIPIV